MRDQREYWNEKIVDWEKTAYTNKALSYKSFLERLATPFRKILKKRMKMAEILVADHVKGKIVVDLGCGTGIFLRTLIKYGPEKLIGVDITQSAIQTANTEVRSLGITRTIEFLYADVRKELGFLKHADIVIGIGFIDYLNAKELLELLRNVKDKQFLFSFPARIFSLREVLHRMYLILASCPGSYKYSKEEMDTILKKAGVKQWWYYDRRSIRFVTNLPKSLNEK